MDISTKYLKACIKDVQMQNNWIPKVGDYAYRRYTMLGEILDEAIWDEEEMSEILILTYQSSADGWFHAIDNVTGENKLFNSKQEIDKKTCVWLPRIDQLQRLLEKCHYEGCNVSLMIDFTNWVEDQWTVNGNTVHSWEWLWLQYYKRFTK